MKGLPFFNERYTRGYLFYQNGVQKGKVLDLGVEPPSIKLYRVLHPLGLIVKLIEIKFQSESQFSFMLNKGSENILSSVLLSLI